MLVDSLVILESGMPVHLQITTGIKRMCLAGKLMPGEIMPSVRYLAASLRVNPMTVSKAYTALVSEGYLDRVAGKQMRVSAGNLRVEFSARLEQLRPELERLLTSAKQLNIDNRSLVSYANEFFKLL